MTIEATEKDFEYCCSSFFCSGKSYLIRCVYRSPTGNYDLFLSNLYDLLDKNVNVFNYILLCGDFNVNFNDYSSNDTNDLIDLFNSYDMLKFVDFPTREDKCIDNIFGNVAKSKFTCWKDDPGLSDHECLFGRFELRHRSRPLFGNL